MFPHIKDPNKCRLDSTPWLTLPLIHKIVLVTMERNPTETLQQRLDRIIQDHKQLGEGFEDLVEGKSKENLKKSLKLYVQEPSY